MTSVLTKFFPIPVTQLALLILLIFFGIHFPQPLSLALISLAFLGILKNYSFDKVLILSILLLFFSTYFYVTKSHRDKHFTHQPLRIDTVTLIPDSTMINGDSLSFRGKNGKNLFQVFYHMKSEEEKKFYKDNYHKLKIRGLIELKEAEGQRYFNGFHYQNHLKNQGIYRIADLKEVKALSIEKPTSISDFFACWRRYCITKCQNQFPKPMSDYMTGLLFGYLDKSFSQMTDIYSQLGIIHFFALSGMQVTFFLNLFRKGLILSRLPIDFHSYFEICFSFIYAGLTGYSISVLRSLIQRNLTNLGLKGDQNIAISFLMMFFINPFFPLTVGGALSFVYVFFLSLIRFENGTGLKGKIGELMALQLAILPFLLLFFSSFHPISILLTVALSFLFDALILPLLTISFFLSPIVICSCVNPLFVILEKLIIMVETFFPNAIIFGQPPIIIFILLILLVAFMIEYRNQKKLLIGAFIGYVLILTSISLPFDNEISIVDVGQGDSILLRDRQNKTLLIDVGGNVNVQGKEEWQKRKSSANAERTLIPYLKSRGIGCIDQLVLTHIDTDHVGDLEVVAKSIAIKEIIVSPGSLTNPQFVKRLAKLGKPVKAMNAGEYLEIMHGKLHLIYPWQKGDGRNNDSLVLYGKLLNHTFIFTGDLEKEGEEAILKRYPNLKADYLKVGHHGSKGSSSEDFIESLQPKAAFISAGKNNRFQHPHKEIINRLKKKEIKIYRTDNEGTIRLKGRHQWWVETTRKDTEK